MKNLLRYSSKRTTPQSYPIPGRESDMIPNYAGAFAFKADKWTCLNRFLIIGSTGGTYYASEKQVTVDNIGFLDECMKENGLRVVNEIVVISESGRAPKSDQAIFALAYCLKNGDLSTRRAAAAAVRRVCRTGTHLFQFSEAVEALGGWGRLTARAIASWYNDQSVDYLAYQLVKYRRRDGVSHADLLRRCHVRRNMNVKDDEARLALYGWLCPTHSPSDAMRAKPGFPREYPWGIQDAERIARDRFPVVEGFIKIHSVGNAREAATLIRQYELPREAVPTHFLNEPLVWEALFEKMPLTAMIRNLGKMSEVGLLTGMSAEISEVEDRLADVERLRKSRIHPITILIALKTYASGHGVMGHRTWQPSLRIADALDEAFYASFSGVEATGKRILIAIDKSGSMRRSASGTVLTAQECAAVMAMVTARTEKEYYIIGYDGRVVQLQISPRQRLDDIVRSLPADGGITDASAPIRWVLDSGLSVDAICLYSDGESWAGHEHASQSIESYRRWSGPVKFCTCDTVANETQLVDNLDELGFHCAGFDEQAPALIANFIRG